MTTRRRSRRLRSAAMAGAKARPSPMNVAWSAHRAKLLLAGFLLGIAAVGFVLFDTDLFYVYAIEVLGTRYVAAADVQKASGVYGYNIFFVDARTVEQRLKQIPEVKTVFVTTSIPNRVTIEIQERKPEVTWLRGTEMYWIDFNGIIFRAHTNLKDLPVLRDLDQTPVIQGQKHNPDALAAFWAFRAAYPEGPRAVEWSAARGLGYTDERGWKISMGNASDMAGKVAKLRALVAQLVAQNARIKFIDLSKGVPYYQ